MNCARLSSRSVRSLTLIAVALIILAFQSPLATAQTAEFTQGSKNSNTLTFEVPLGNYPGRGISLPVTLRYSSQGLWRIGLMTSANGNTAGRSVAEAIYAEHSTAGWKTSLDVPRIEWPKLSDRYYADGKPYPRYAYPNTYRVANVFVHMPDGSTYELRKTDQVYQDQLYIDMTGTFYAVDGSRMRYDSSGEMTGTLYLADGTRWIFNGSTVQYIDRNGNTLNYNPATRQWTDTLGRVFNMPWPANPGAGDYSYSLPGINGTSLNYTLKFRYLSDTLAPGSPALAPIADYYLPYPESPPTNSSGSNFPQPTGTSTMFYSDQADDNPISYTYVVGRGQYGATNFNPVVLAEIVLPNGQSYRLQYNNYGEVTKVLLPTGGYQRYTYSEVPTIGGATTPFHQGSRGITSKWLSPSGSGTDEAQWTYSTTGSVVTVTAPNGTRSETHIHNALAALTNFGYRDARTGLPYEERIYAPPSQGGAMLRRTLIEYEQTSASFNRPSPGSGTYTAYRNARATKSVSLILDTGGDALASATTTSYDTTYQFSVGLDATASNEYGFAVVDQTTAQTAPISSMPFGPLVRSTQATFLTDDAGYRDRNILGLASSVTIRNAANQIVAQSTIAYDEPGYPLMTYGSLTSWTDPQTSYRGNATTANRWLDYPTPTWISTHTQYDQAGSVRNAWDARGNQSQVDYSATYARAFPTQTTSAVPDPAGTHGSTTPLAASSVYDFNTGLVTSTTDANNKTTTFEYNDSLNRRTRVNLPDGGRTTTTYVDAHSCGAYIQTKTLLNASGTETDSSTFFDGLGRAYRAFTYENQDTSNPYLTVDTQYDSMGRGWRTSNPYRSNGCTSAINPSANWTTNTYDSLSRATAVTTPDGAQVSTAYSAVTTGSYIGPSVTVTDPAGKSRQSVSDASGQVIQVIEAPNGPAFETNYTYDALNNLRKVEQGSQARYFGYDSLSRVLRVRHIEQTVNDALNWTDPVTGNGSWTTALSYDPNGNVSSRVDARNITTNYIYDNLNRPKTKLYRINGEPDPNTGDVEYLYDNATNGRGRPWITYTSGANPFQTAVGGYDAVGRVTQLYRLFGNGQGGWHPAYGMSAAYNLAGHLTSLTYPSGRTVNYGYDGSGRLNSFNGNLGGEQRTYASAIEYSTFGGMSREQYGTQIPLYQKAFYNVRGQMFDKRLSSVNDMWDWNRGRLIWYFSSNHVWGGSGTDNNGNVRFQEMWVPPPNATLDQAQYLIEDSYTYDALNRLTAVNESSLNIGGGGSWQGQFAQVYSYDRYGNRTIDQTNTWGAVPKPNFGVNAATNQLTAPSGYTMSYDAAGNLTNDTYTGQGARTYDAENHMKQAWGNNQWQTYVYDGEGARIKRIVNGTETWQVHGLGGELVAEYAPVASPSSPQKEYGYRNGELLITAASPSGSGGSGQPVNWTNAVGVTVSGNSLTKTAAQGWNNSGAASTQTIASGDGYVEMTASETTTYRMLGLSNGDSNQDYTDIDFAIYPAEGAGLHVYEGGVYRGTFGSYTTGDVLRVSVESGVVKYKKNGAVLYTSTVAPTYPLLVDVALYSPSSTISSAVIGGNVSSSSTQNVNWTNTVGVSVSGNSLTKTAAQGWGNAGASSTQSISSGDGYVEFTAAQMGVDRVCGLSVGDSNQSHEDIDFGILLSDGGYIYAWESGAMKANAGPYTTSDKLKVAVESGQVKYYKNGTLFYTSTVAPTYPLLVDTALYSSGATLTNVVISSSGSGAVNVALASNGATASASSSHTCCGFSLNGPINGNINGPWDNGEGWNDATPDVLPDWYQVDFAGSKTIHEIDVFSLHDNYTQANTPTETQTFTLYGLVNFEVQYWNGSAWATVPGGNVTGNNKVWRKFMFAPITTSKIRLWITAVPDAWSRLVEIQAYEAAGGGGPQNVTWTNASGVAVNGNSLTKTAAVGWGNAGASSTQTIASGDGYVEFTASETTTYRMLGLSNGDSNQDYTDIDFALYLGGYPTGGVVEVYEAGVHRGTFGSYATGDIMRVAVEGGVVKYKKNGVVFYTSTVAPTYPLLVDTALYSSGATLTNVVVSGGGGGGGGSSATIRWVVTDRLGTPRMIFDQTGSYSSVSRHDYLPFGEELFAGVGGRTSGQGYTATDGVRQKFTGFERDAESGLDYAHARYYANQQGRFTSVDPLGASADITDPQSFNRYSYVLNSPTNLTDPTGMMAGANVGWSGAADGFWGSSSNFGSPPLSAGLSIIAAAEAQRDRLVKARTDGALAQHYLDGGNYDAAKAIFSANPDVGLFAGGVDLWGDLANAYVDGASQPIEVAQRGMPWVGAKEHIKRGLQYVARAVRSRRLPDFYLISVGAAGFETGHAITRGCNYIFSFGGSSGPEGSIMAGWLLQFERPTEGDLASFLTGASGTGSIFWNHRTGWGAGGGAGLMRSFNNPGTKWATLLGVGVGGGFSVGTGFDFDFAGLTRRFFPGRR